MMERVWMKLILCFSSWTHIFSGCWRLAILIERIIIILKKKAVMLTLLPIAWISTGIPINILCLLLKGLPTTLKTDKPLKPWKSMSHVNPPKCSSMSFPEELCPPQHPLSPTPAPEKAFGKNSLEDFLWF